MPSSVLEVVLTHEHTDFDALASLYGAALIFPGSLPVLPRQLNHNVRDFLALYRDHFPFVNPRDLPRGWVRQAILVDTNSFNAVKGMNRETTYLVIDHHGDDEPLPPKWQRWQESLGSPEVGANTTLLVEVLMAQERWLFPVQTTLLALGIYEDTGCLMYKSTTARDARCVTWLLEQGANLEVINRFIRYPLSEDQRHLYQVLIENSEHLTIAGHSVVIAQAEATGFKDEISALAHQLRNLYKPDVLFLIVDLGDRVQVVARSTTDDVDVGRVAEALGGGGHTRAAAVLIRGQNSRAIHSRVVSLIKQYSRPPMTVRRIMSRGRPQILDPETPVQTAVELMRRYGHEGFPVVETVKAAPVGQEPAGTERLLGMLTRREADRAVSHGLGKEPVHRFMRAGAHTVTPDDTIHTLQKCMIDSGWGQIPVVNDSGSIVGIVTRTDLIKLWGEGEPRDRLRAEVARRLVEALTPVQHHLLQLVGQMAAQAQQSVYVVGGFARDLMLGSVESRIRALDMDIVVEGDAIALAEHLQARCGGRVVTHRRFGTAKWLLTDAEKPIHCRDLLNRLDGDLPPHLDFVTARTEFYTEPTVLPTVERGSIKLDLHRRDFSINTLAVSLLPDHWGELIDSYGGLTDLRQGVVRVLHSLSFVDDPTRILRAVRYEQRFNFRIEARTLELLQDAVELLDRVTPARIRHEFERILQEERPEKALVRLDELGVLRRFHPQLQADGWLRQHFAALRNARRRIAAGEGRSGQEDTPLLPRFLPPDIVEPLERLYWALLVYRMSPQADEVLAQRLTLHRDIQRTVDTVRRLQASLLELLDPTLRPGQATELLDEVTPAAMLLVSLVERDERLRAVFDRYLTEWRYVEADIDGQDLRAMGLKAGPIYGQILRRIRAARLDGAIVGREEALAMAETLVRAEVEEQGTED